MKSSTWMSLMVIVAAAGFLISELSGSDGDKYTILIGIYLSAAMICKAIEDT